MIRKIIALPIIIHILNKTIVSHKISCKTVSSSFKTLLMIDSFSDLTVLVDKRITLGAFKGELEPHVGTTSDNFKVQVYSTHIP